MQRILEVRNASVTFVEQHGKVVFSASGAVSSTGWTAPELSPWRYITTPADKFLDFDFQAQEPAGTVMPVVSDISVERVETFDVANYWGNGIPLKGIRVHGLRGYVESAIVRSETSTSSGLFYSQIGDLENAKGPAGELSSLIGNPVRVFHEGDIITMDNISNRFNIVTKPGTNIASRIYFG